MPRPCRPSLPLWWAWVDDPVRTVETVDLTVEAVHAETKGRRIFTASDYPAFIITDPAAVDFFKHFTTPNQ